MGYSGTNATGVLIRDSLWDRNGAGILPNTYANEALPPQARTTIVRNTVTNSGRARVPIHTVLAGFIGIGIAVAGGNQNAIRDNRILRSERYGIAVFPTARFVTFRPVRSDPGPPWRPHGNRIVQNVVSGSGVADLVVAKGSGKGNCFRANVVRTTQPRRLQTLLKAGVCRIDTQQPTRGVADQQHSCFLEELARRADVQRRCLVWRDRHIRPSGDGASQRVPVFD